MSKIIQFVSKHNSHCVTAVICDDDKVAAEIAKKKEFNHTIFNWYGDRV